MKLADFIRGNIEILLLEWDKFALSIDSANNLDKKGRRDHAREMLMAIATDLDKPQTEAQQIARSKGQAPFDPDADTAAEEHGVDRLTPQTAWTTFFVSTRQSTSRWMNRWPATPTKKTWTLAC